MSNRPLKLDDHLHIKVEPELRAAIAQAARRERLYPSCSLAAESSFKTVISTSSP